MKRTTKKNGVVQSLADRDLAAQREYENRAAQQPGAFSIAVGRSFVLGMRQQGYRDTCTALDELVDNAIQAGATRIDVAFGYEGAEKSNQPTALAVIDNGHGMDGAMIRLAMTFGGSHRADIDDRSGFGRFGFGLPAAALSQALSYTVFSATEGPAYRCVNFDVDRLTNYISGSGALEVPKDREAALPGWVEEYLKRNKISLARGTVVVLEKLDNIKWKTRAALTDNLTRHFGLYYRKLLGEIQIVVDSQRAPVIDPLFLMEDARYYEAPDGIRAEAWPTTTVEVKSKDGGKGLGTVTVRYSFMPYRFAAGTDYDAFSSDEERHIKSARFQILKEARGIVVMRHGRQIAVVEPPRAGTDGAWFDLIPADVHWKCEIDFPATLDEEFGITTSKQTAQPSARIWQILKEHDVARTCLQMRYQRRGQASAAKSAGTAEQVVEQIMSSLQQKKRRKFLGDDRQLIAAANKRLERDIEVIHKETGLDRDLVAQRLKNEIEKRPYVIERESAKEGPFYRLETRGSQRKMFLNTDHPFCAFYDSLPNQMKWLSLLLLYVIADAELDADGGEEKRNFYRQERPYWSANLRIALERLMENHLVEQHESRDGQLTT